MTREELIANQQEILLSLTRTRSSLRELKRMLEERLPDQQAYYEYVSGWSEHVDDSIYQTLDRLLKLDP